MMVESKTKTIVDHHDLLPNGKSIKIEIGVKVKSRRGGRWFTKDNIPVYLIRVDYTVINTVGVIYVICKGVGFDGENVTVSDDLEYLQEVPRSWKKTGLKDVIKRFTS